MVFMSKIFLNLLIRLQGALHTLMYGAGSHALPNSTQK